MIYKSSVVIERIDYLLMEKGSGESVFPQSEFINMVSEVLCTPIEQIWRVKLLDNDDIELSDFTLARKEKNFISTRCLNKADVPQWIVDKISVLQIIPNGEQVDGVGQKVSDQVFYVIE